MKLAPDFDEFIGCLTARGVEFLLVGAATRHRRAPAPTVRLSDR